MHRDKITVIMPTYNSMPYLKSAIKSIFDQDYLNWELIISDDCSNDKTISFLKKLKHDKIKIFYQKKNLGIFNNLKFLDSKVKTSIVKILCADDIMLKNCLSDISIFMKKFESCNLLSFFDQNSKKIFSERNENAFYLDYGNKKYSYFNSSSAMVVFFAFGNILGNLSRTAYRKKKNDTNPNFDQKYPYVGDFNAWVIFSKKNGFYLIKKKLVYVRVHSKRGSVTLNRNNEMYPQVNKVYSYLLTNIDKKYHKKLRKYILLNYFPSRITAYFSSLFNGKILNAKRVFHNSPLNISMLDCLIHSIFYKFNNNIINNTYRNHIINIIKNLNNKK